MACQPPYPWATFPKDIYWLSTLPPPAAENLHTQNDHLNVGISHLENSLYQDTAWPSLIQQKSPTPALTTHELGSINTSAGPDHHSEDQDWNLPQNISLPLGRSNFDNGGGLAGNIQDKTGSIFVPNIGLPNTHTSTFGSTTSTPNWSACQQDVSYSSRSRSQEQNSRNPGNSSKHANANPGQSKTCRQCTATFVTKSEIDTHAKTTLHSPHACICKASFSRLEDLSRHIHSQTSTPENECKQCAKAFIRNDHLTQHVRRHHRIRNGQLVKKVDACPHRECGGIFKVRSLFTKHLRDVHDESLYPCLEYGCERTRSRGYFRKKDLVNHVKLCHQSFKY